MYARKIKPEEYPRTEELFCIAFEFPETDKPEPEARIKRVSEKPEDRIELNFTERWASFDEDGQMAAFISAPPYPVQFDGQTVDMTAIGGVSTLPQYRKCGAMRSCFEKALTDMYEEGRELSYLYPFSQSYYRKYGYEICGQKIRYEIDLRAIPAIRTEGGVRLLEKGNIAEDVKAVYQAFAAKYNLAVRRDDIDFVWAQKADPSRDGRYVYVCYTESGKPCAVVDFTKEKRGEFFDMVCRQFWPLGKEGLQEAFALMRSFSTYYSRVRFFLPDDMELSEELPEWALYPAKRELQYLGMARVIRAEKVLEKAAYRGDGRFMLCLEDRALAGNNDLFAVTFADGKAVSVKQSHETESGIPVLTLSVGVFSRLILEGCAPDKLVKHYGAKTEDLELWRRVFYKKTVWLDDAF